MNTQDKEHVTPLHFASYRQNLESARVLLDYDADVNARDNWGHGETIRRLKLLSPRSAKTAPPAIR